jgi:hypothetical protein
MSVKLILIASLYIYMGQISLISGHRACIGFSFAVPLHAIYYSHSIKLVCSSVTENANFNITQTSLTLLGFTQPQSALPIIHNPQNNAKGFTSRILWYFPEPIYSRLRDLELTDEERLIAEQAQQSLGNFHMQSMQFFHNISFYTFNTHAGVACFHTINS